MDRDVASLSCVGSDFWGEDRCAGGSNPANRYPNPESRRRAKHTDLRPLHRELCVHCMRYMFAARCVHPLQVLQALRAAGNTHAKAHSVSEVNDEEQEETALNRHIVQERHAGSSERVSCIRPCGKPLECWVAHPARSCGLDDARGLMRVDPDYPGADSAPSVMHA